MKKIMIACVALLGSALALGEKKGEHKYPAVFWSPTSSASFSETQAATEHATLASSLKSLVSGDSQRVYLIRKEGMSTHDFFRIARYLEYDRAIMANHSVSFSHVGKNGFDAEAEMALEEALGGVKANQYNLDAEAEIPVLAQTFASQAENGL